MTYRYSWYSQHLLSHIPYLFVCLFYCVFWSISLSLFVFLSVYLSVYLSASPCLSLSLCLSFSHYLSLSLSLSLSVSLSVLASLLFSLCLCHALFTSAPHTVSAIVSSRLLYPPCLSFYVFYFVNGSGLGLHLHGYLCLNSSKL